MLRCVFGRLATHFPSQRFPAKIRGYFVSTVLKRVTAMAKPGRKVKKANHGKRPACSRPRKSRRQKVRT
jgi:hypothetical protein